MIFFPIILFGIALYFTKWRMWSGVIFFFFFSKGFQFVPDKFFETSFIVSKAPDFALIYVLAICLIGIIRYDNFIVKNKITIGIAVFTAFVLISILYSRFSLNVIWSDIIRTSRYFFFVYAYFVFRRFTKEEVLGMLKILAVVTLVGNTLYVIQSVTGFPLLAESSPGKYGVLNRYYNFTILFYVLIGYIFCLNPFKGFWRYYSIVIFCLVAVASQHRLMMFAIFVSCFWGIIIQEGGLKGVFKYLFIGGLALLPVLDVLIDRFSDNTTKDIDSVLGGAFTDYSGELSIDGTFLFRMALLYERGEYILEEPARMVFGVGMMAENSAQAEQEFNFVIGLKTPEDTVVQLDTADIAWVPFVLRLGIVGTVIYLSLYFMLGRFFYKYRKEKFMLASFFYIILISINSISSVELSNTQMIVPLLIAYAYKENELKLSEDVQNLE